MQTTRPIHCIHVAAPTVRRPFLRRILAFFLRLDTRYRAAQTLAEIPAFRLGDMGISRDADDAGAAKADLPAGVRHGW